MRTPDDEVGVGYVTTTYQYGSRAVTGNESGAIGTVGYVTNPKSIRTKSTTSSQGKVVAIIQNDTASAGSVSRTITTKTYDALGQLTETNAEGAIITHAYDIRGRRIGTTDPDMGTWTYEYNAFGELKLQTDAKDQDTETIYDNLGRPTMRKVYVASSTTVEELTQWTYDTAPTAGKGIGKLHTAETFNAAMVSQYKETHTCDSLGRPATLTRRIDGADYTFTLSYDSYGRVQRSDYPDGFATQNYYNAFSVLKEVRRVDGGRNEIYWMAAPSAAYNAAGALEQYYVGNGVSTTRILSPATGRLRGINTGVRYGAGVQGLDYDYDTVGNVVVRNDAALDRTETFYYDDLNRLAASWLNGNHIDVTYDKKGNIVTKSDVGTYAYTGPRPHAVTSTTGGPYAHTYSYDANGNMENGAGRGNEWTAFNQLRRVDMAGGKFSEFWFGAAHERVKQVSHNGTTIYVGSLYEKFVPTSGPTEYSHWVSTPAGRVAVHKTYSSGAPKTEFFHHDGLASITAVTNASGAVVQRFAYDAWGRRNNPANGVTTTFATSAGVPRGFTDHEHLDDLGLIHLNGRVYDPVLGRFLSADPNIDGADDSQGYNRFTYVRNNPLNFTDPTGYLKLWKDLLGPIVQMVAGYYFGPLGSALVGATLDGWKGAAQGYLAGLGGNLTALGGGSWNVGYAAASGFSGSLLNGGSIGDAFKAGIIGGGQAYFAGAIGGKFGHGTVGGSWHEFSRGFWHGALGGAVEEAQGGEFRHGFYAGFAGSAGGSFGFSLFGFGDDAISIGVRTAFAATLGGTAAELGGGKFANGAQAAAFQHLYNGENFAQAGLANYAAQMRADFMCNQSAAASIGRTNDLMMRLKRWAAVLSFTKSRKGGVANVSAKASIEEGSITLNLGVGRGNSAFIGLEETFYEIEDAHKQFAVTLRAAAPRIFIAGGTTTYFGIDPDGNFGVVEGNYSFGFGTGRSIGNYRIMSPFWKATLWQVDMRPIPIPPGSEFITFNQLSRSR